MSRRIYDRFEFVDTLPSGLLEAKDEADGSTVTLFESNPDDPQKEANDNVLKELAKNLGCETFTAGPRRYIVAKTDEQKSGLVQELIGKGFLDATAALAGEKSSKPAEAGPIIDHSVKESGNGCLGVLLALFAVAALLAAGGFAYWRYFMPPEVALRLEGSTTVGDELAPKLLMEFLRTKNATDIEILPPSGSDKTHHDVRARLPGHWRPEIFSVIANGSGHAFEALGAGRADIGMASRPINNKEFNLLEPIGDLRSPCCEAIIALDGLAIVVNSSNPVTALTRKQIGDVFRGNSSNWMQFGGANRPIHLYGRNSDSGTFDTFTALILQGDKKAFSNQVKVEDNGDEITKAVSSDPDGIGFVALAQIRPAKALEISDGEGTAPLLPSGFTVATEDYILSRRLFLYTPSRVTDLAGEFVKFASSPAGQEVVEAVGFVKQTPAFENPPVPAGAPEDYVHRVAGLRRLNINFRFRPNSITLDNKALADLPRVENTLLANRIQTGVQIIGFADSQGSYEHNLDLSRQRADVVAKQLKAFGITLQSTGYSSAIPVGDNSTADGREKNRRVEIWVP